MDCYGMGMSHREMFANYLKNKGMSIDEAINYIREQSKNSDEKGSRFYSGVLDGFYIFW